MEERTVRGSHNLAETSLTAMVTRHLEDVLLHVLESGSGHAYELAARVNARSLGVTQLQPAQLYPVMVRLVAAGAVAMTDAAGTYVLTPVGRAELADADPTWTRVDNALIAAATQRRQQLKRLVADRLQGLFGEALPNQLMGQVTADLMATAEARCVAGMTVPVAVNAAVAAFGDPVCLRAAAVTLTEASVNSATSPNATPGTPPVATGHAVTAIDDDTETPDHSAAYDLRGVATVQLDFGHADVRVVPVEGVLLAVREYDVGDEPACAFSVMGDVARLVQKSADVENQRRPRIIVGVPATFRGQLHVVVGTGDVQVLNLRQLTTLVLQVTEGHANLTYLAAKLLSATLRQGDLTLQGSQIERNRLTTAAGDMLVAQSVMTSLTAVVTDGDLTVRKVGVDETADLLVAKGDLTLSGAHAGALAARVPMGQIVADWTVPRGRVTLSAGADVMLEVPDATDFDLQGPVVQVTATATVTQATSTRQQGSLGTASGLILDASTTAGTIHLNAIN